jgi:ornithine cyclodeaminase
VQFLSAAQTREHLPFAALIDALRTMFAEGCELPARQVHEIVGPHGVVMTSLVMPAWQRGGCYGVKVINIAPGNSARGLPGLHSTYVLYDATTGAPLAWLDGNEITARRTAATSALAASWLARKDARSLAIIGAGRVAALLAAAHRVHRPIERVTVWARDGDRARAFAASLASQCLDVRVAASVEAAVADVDIVSCATLARDPIVKGRWLRADSHLDLIGSFTPAMREADDACFAGAAVFIDSDDAPTKSGELIGPIARGVVTVGDIGTLAELARGRRPQRDAAAPRTVFKSVGSALEDLAAAILVQRALHAMP